MNRLLFIRALPRPLAPRPLAPRPLAPRPLAPRPLAPRPLAPCPLALLFCVAVFLVAAWAPHVVGQEAVVDGSDNPAELVEVPHPPLGAMEAAVRGPLSESRGRLEAALGDPSSAAGRSALASAFGDLGELYLVYDLGDAAEACFENAAHLDPTSARWPYLHGSLLEHDRALERSFELYRTALELDPAYLPTRLRMARIHVALGRPAEARRTFEEVLRTDPTSAAAHAGLARIAEQDQRWDEAARHLERASELQPGASALNYRLALVYREAGRAEEAREKLAERGTVDVHFADPIADSVKMRAEGGGVQSLLAGRAIESGSPELGLGRMRQAAAADPGNASIQGTLGGLLASQGLFDEAAEALDRAIGIEPDSVRWRATYSRVLSQLDRHEDAISQQRTALELAPDFHDLRADLSAALARTGDLDGAIDELSRALDGAPDHAVWRWRRFFLLQRAERPSDAVTEIRTILELDPESADAHFQLGTLLLGSDPAQSESELLRAVELDPDLGAAHQNLALLLGRQERYLESAGHQARVVALDTANAEAHLVLATARILGGAHPDARAGLESALALHRDDPRIANILARLLATAPDEEVRDGTQAMDIAAKVFEAYPAMEHAKTLAMAFAEGGRFEQAVALQQRVVEELQKIQAPAPLQAEAQRHLDAYRRNEPVRSPWATAQRR